VGPIVLFKMVMVQHLFGIHPLKPGAADVDMNNACRWFIGYPLNKPAPHFATVSYNFCHRFSGKAADLFVDTGRDRESRLSYAEAVFVGR